MPRPLAGAGTASTEEREKTRRKTLKDYVALIVLTHLYCSLSSMDLEVFRLGVIPFWRRHGPTLPEGRLRTAFTVDQAHKGATLTPYPVTQCRGVGIGHAG